MTATSFNDLVFNINLEPFQLKKYSDFTFSCDGLSVDFSDYKNPTTLRFPGGYRNVYQESEITLWRGVHISNARVILNGEKFKRKNSNLPIIFQVEDLIIDETGFFGNLYVKNLLPLTEGDIGGWDIGIDELSLQFMQGDIIGGGLKGEIHIPAFKNNNFKYSAYIDAEGKYFFNIKTRDNLDFDLFGKGKLNIYPSSYITIIGDSTGFHGIALFNGKMDICAPLTETENEDIEKKPNFKLKGLEFQELVISTKSPYIDLKYLSYHGEKQADLSRFPVTIDNFEFINTINDAKLKLDILVNLQSADEGGFSGKTILEVRVRKENKKFTYAGVRLNYLSVEFGKPEAFYIKGAVNFIKGDSIYGDGFKGSIMAKFSKFEMEALALFGNAEGMRYFFVDALVAGKPALINAGVISIFGFGGGLFYRMKQQTGNIDKGSIGASLSGIVYKPDASIFIGLRAAVVLGIVSDNIAKGTAKFEIAFTNKGGVSNIGFEGDVECITTPVEIDVGKVKNLSGGIISGVGGNTDKSVNSAIMGKLYMNMDFQNKVFHASLDIMVNVGGVVKGIGNNNRAGWAVIHCDSAQWYIHIGTPYDPLGLKIENLFQIKAYFMAGHNLPTTFPVHPKVAKILGISISDVIESRENNLSLIEKGKGIAFGASFDLSTGNITFLMFYGSFSLGGGFDMNMINYGKNSYCQGHNPPLGINGWYAKGQAYAYVSGDIGLTAKVFGKRKNFEILSIAAAVWLQAEGPNTFWMRGIVGGSYNVLGGMIKGNCRFQLEVGKKCEIKGVSNAYELANLQLIGDITPTNNSENVDVFVTPQIVFNVPVESVQKINDDDGKTKLFRVKLSEVKIKRKTDNVNIHLYYQWNNDKTVLQVIPYDPLWAETEYNIEVKIIFEVDNNGKWEPYKEDGQILSESRTVKFTTGMPDKISAGEVLCTYPMSRQYNYMPYEYPYAYMMTLRNIEGIFVKNEKYMYKARWSTMGQILLTDIEYKGTEKTLYIKVPENLKLNSIYHLEILLIPTEKGSSIDKNVIETINTITDDSTGSTAKLTTRSAEGTITTSEEKVLYEWYFKTSKHRTFNEKINIFSKNVRALYDRTYMAFYLITEMPGGEMFDRFELEGTDKIKPLIQMEADLNNTPWFNEEVYPMTYEKYPWFGRYAILWRDTTIYGLKAQKAISIWQPAIFNEFTDEEIQIGFPLADHSFCDLVYMSPYFWDSDYMQIRDGIATDVEKDPSLVNNLVKKILATHKLRAVKPGQYPVIFKYILPGKNQVTTTKRLIINNTISTDAKDF